MEQNRSSTPEAALTRQGLLQDRVAIITGAARGLGLAIAKTLGLAGARVVICDIDGEALEQAASELRTLGLSVHAVPGNVAQVVDNERMVRAALDAFGRVDVLVNNAGGSANTPRNLEDVTEEDYDRVMDWNVRGTFFCTKAALEALKGSQGCIVNLASLAGQMGGELWSPQYSAAKGAIIALTRNFAKQLGKYGIRVNAVAPGFVPSSERVLAIWKGRDNTPILEGIALKRPGTMDEVADAVLFLVSDQSRYVSGTILDIDGGYHAG